MLSSDFFVVIKMSFAMNCGLYLVLITEGIGFCLDNATMIQIQDMFENGKPDIVLKAVKVFLKVLLL